MTVKHLHVLIVVVVDVDGVPVEEAVVSVFTALGPYVGRHSNCSVMGYENKDLRALMPSEQTDGDKISATGLVDDILIVQDDFLCARGELNAL